jgi:serine/threonine-protein kinase
VLEALDAVGQAHAAGIVHRDLKPANLFLAQRPDGSQRVKVLDFGISKRVGATTADQLSLTKTSAWIGSPLYMAPEQMQSARDVDARADIWSMGAILYECIAGRPPYVAESLPQLCNLLITTDPTHLSERAPGIPQDLADAVMACLVRDPSGRIDNAGELARRIARHATTATGSGMRLSLGMLDVTEMQTGTGASWSTSTPSGAQPNSVLSTGNAAATGDGPSAPSASIASSGVGAVSAGSARAEASEFGATEHSQSGVSPLQPGASSITAGRTHAAWGGTGAAPTQTGRSGLRYGIVAAVVLLGGAVGYVVQRGQSAPEPEQVSELPMVAAPGIGSEVAAPDVLETGAGLVPAVDLVPAADLVPADPTAAKATDEQPPTGASSRPQESDPRSVDQPSQVVKPAVAPAPRPRSQVPRPVSAPRPAVSAPAPTPAPAPKSDDPFSGFGKRK